MPLPEEKATVKHEVKPHTPIPEDTYTVQLWDVGLSEGDPDAPRDFQKEDRIKILFVILDKEFRGTILNKMASFSFNAGAGKKYSPSTLYGLACAIKGETLDDREPLNINALIGGICRIVVKHGKPIEDGSVWEKVTDFMAVKEKMESITQDEFNAIKEVKDAEAKEVKK